MMLTPRTRNGDILHIDSSILGQSSVSRQLSAEAVAAITAVILNTKFVYRDLAAAPFSHLSGAYLGDAKSPTAEHATAAADLAGGFAALQEFCVADTLVIGVAVYNF